LIAGTHKAGWSVTRGLIGTGFSRAYETPLFSSAHASHRFWWSDPFGRFPNRPKQFKLSL
jgi:hypothetical protein